MYIFQQQPAYFIFFFFNDTATTEIYTLSLHDALPIYFNVGNDAFAFGDGIFDAEFAQAERSEEHTSELQSQSNLVCRLLLEKKKKRRRSRSRRPTAGGRRPWAGTRGRH